MYNAFTCISIPQEKATAVNMLSCYAEELKDGFWEYVPAVLKLVINGAEGQSPLIKFYLNEEVREGSGWGGSGCAKHDLNAVRGGPGCQRCVARIAVYLPTNQRGGNIRSRSGLAGVLLHT